MLRSLNVWESSDALMQSDSSLAFTNPSSSAGIQSDMLEFNNCLKMPPTKPENQDKHWYM